MMGICVHGWRRRIRRDAAGSRVAFRRKRSVNVDRLSSTKWSFRLVFRPSFASWPSVGMYCNGLAQDPYSLMFQSQTNGRISTPHRGPLLVRGGEGERAGFAPLCTTLHYFLRKDTHER